MSYTSWIVWLILLTAATDAIVMGEVPKGRTMDSRGVTWRILLLICLPLSYWFVGILNGLVLNSAPVLVPLFLIGVNALIFGFVVFSRLAFGDR